MDSLLIWIIRVMTLTHITFNNVLNEYNNPELFELDEAGEIAFYLIKQMTSLPKEKWITVDDNFPDSDKVVANRGFLGTTLILDRNILDQLSKNIRPDVKKILVNFIVGKNLKEPINSWGAAEAAGEIEVNILFTAKSSLVEIRNELTQTLAHELNHAYDYYDFNKPKQTKSAMLRNDAMNKMFADIQKSKADVMQYIKSKNIQVDQNYIEFIQWLLDFNEIKSISKEIIYEMEYRSVPYTDANHIRVRNMITSHLIKKVIRNNANSANVNLTRGVVKIATNYIQQIIDIYNQRLVTP